jgi:hypothetical protein
MAGKDKFGMSNDDVFGKTKRAKATQPATPVEEKRSVGKPKIIPDSFRKVNFMLDQTNIKKLRMKALEEDVSVNILLNRIIAEYVK